MLPPTAVCRAVLNYTETHRHVHSCRQDHLVVTVVANQWNRVIAYSLNLRVFIRHLCQVQAITVARVQLAMVYCSFPMVNRLGPRRGPSGEDLRADFFLSCPDTYCHHNHIDRRTAYVLNQGRLEATIQLGS